MTKSLWVECFGWSQHFDMDEELSIGKVVELAFDHWGEPLVNIDDWIVKLGNGKELFPAQTLKDLFKNQQEFHLFVAPRKKEKTPRTVVANWKVQLDFDPKQRAYPFPTGNVLPFIEVTDTFVKFTGQRGPIKECGLNGCQIDDMVRFARMTLESFNRAVPSRETSLAITKLEEAEMWLNRRTEKRVAEKKEGTSAQ